MRKLLFFVFAMLGLNASAQITFTNPVLSGFYPDPSVTRVGTDYYLVNSTFSYFPGIPVFHSKDLKNWKQIGNVIDRPSQMTFIGDGTSRGLFAPSIYFNKGTYYVTCTNIDNKGNFVVTAKNPAGPWSDPVYLKGVNGIDPSLFFDTDNKAYIIYNSDAPDRKPLYDGHRTIRMYEFDAENLKVKGEEMLMVNGGVDISTKPVWIEGPHLFKRGEWYYICAAEGGTSVNHSQVILRSKSPTGPFIPYDKNPILTQRHLDPNRPNPITSAGHAELVDGPDGKTYAIFLAVRPYEGDYYNTGRETFIAPVTWTDGWPIINPGIEEIQYKYTADFKEVKQAGALPQSGAFKYRLSFDKKLDPALLFLRTHDPSWYTLTKKQGLTMKLLPETVMGSAQPAFIGKRQQHLYSSASTVLDFKAANDKEQAGLLAFQSEKHFYYLCKSIVDGKPLVQLLRGPGRGGKQEVLAEQVLANATAPLYLRIDAKGGIYNFLFAEKAGDWKVLKDNVDGKFISTKQAGGFIGVLFALYASSNGETSNSKASFKWLDYEGN